MAVTQRLVRAPRAQGKIRYRLVLAASFLAALSSCADYPRAADESYLDYFSRPARSDIYPFAYPPMMAVPGYSYYYGPYARPGHLFYGGMYGPYGPYRYEPWLAGSWYGSPWGMVGPWRAPYELAGRPAYYNRGPPPQYRGRRGNESHEEFAGQQRQRHRQSQPRQPPVSSPPVQARPPAPSASRPAPVLVHPRSEARPRRTPPPLMNDEIKTDQF